MRLLRNLDVLRFNTKYWLLLASLRADNLKIDGNLVHFCLLPLPVSILLEIFASMCSSKHTAHDRRHIAAYVRVDIALSREKRSQTYQPPRKADDSFHDSGSIFRSVRQ